MVPEEDLGTLVAGNDHFAFDLFHHLSSTDERAGDNLIISPYSLSLVLAMAYAGAEGNTADQMAQVLHYDLPPAQLHPAFNVVNMDLTDWAAAQADQGVQLDIANSLWGQEDLGMQPPFLDTLATNYGTGVHLLDFTTESESARLLINEWVSEKTHTCIQDLLPSGSLDELTRLVLVDAIYLDVPWAHPFSEDNTKEERFYLLDGGDKIVPMMTKTRFYHYAETDDLQAVRLPYRGGRLDLVILLPAENHFHDVAAQLNSDYLQSLFSAEDWVDVHLTMPRFTITSPSISMSDVLQSMGMTDAFNAELADFSGIGGEVYIRDVFHKAFIEVREKGTEAAAASGVVMVTPIVAVIESEPPVEMTVDRPFLFYIEDQATGTILFLGQVLNPQSESPAEE